MYKLKLKVVFVGGSTLSITETFDQLVKDLLTSEKYELLEPLKITFQGTGKVIYFDKPKIQAYHEGELPYENLVRATLCDELYRNTKDMQSRTGDQVEAGSLWMLKNNELILVDDDRYVLASLDPDVFIIAE